jgi:hypothetical protein
MDRIDVIIGMTQRVNILVEGFQMGALTTEAFRARVFEVFSVAGILMVHAELVTALVKGGIVTPMADGQGDPMRYARQIVAKVTG